MAPSAGRDHVLILDFAGGFAERASEFLRHSGHVVLIPQSGPEAAGLFAAHRNQIAFIVAASEHAPLASAMQSAEPALRVFLFDGADPDRSGSQPQDTRRNSWLSSLRTFP